MAPNAAPRPNVVFLEDKTSTLKKNVERALLDEIWRRVAELALPSQHIKIDSTDDLLAFATTRLLLC